ncbi:MAG: flagellar basal body-associated FliL family protein [Planctomycetes bacterium]|nr:flagellar basal body-associated FliL family protein [Planctomycetota bacterium]
MPPNSAAERTGASSPSYAVPPPPPPRRMMSPAGYLGLGVAMIFTLFIVLRIVSSFQAGQGAAASPDGYEEVDLGAMTRELSPESGGLVREPFMLKVVLVLNPKVRDLGALKSQVERRKNLFRDIVWTEILDPKSDAELRKPAVLEAMKSDIRQRINQEMEKQVGVRDGQEPVSRVLFPDRKPPERR